MTSSAAYLEAQRRIRAAKQSGQHWLDLGDIENLEEIPEEIGELTELRELGVGMERYDETSAAWLWENQRWYVTKPLKTLSTLEGLTALQSFYLSDTHVSDLSPLRAYPAKDSSE